MSMESGFPMLNCLLQHTLRSLCTCSSSDSSSDTSNSSSSSKWVYAVFWRILPRNYPPPKWDHGGGVLDRAKGNKRNWILMWEDGFCDFCECEREGSEYIKGRFGADIFFKLSHEVYNYGEGMVGKVAADNSHKWVFRENPENNNDPTFISSWNATMDPQPRAWEIQFNSGIQTIALISVREGIIQLGSFDKIVEDLNLVMSIQRKFSYLQSIPGIYSIQRPYSHPIQYPYTFNFKSINNPAHVTIEPTEPEFVADDNKRLLIGSKRLINGDMPDFKGSIKSINLGSNYSPHFGLVGSFPPLLPSISCSFGALLAKLPYCNDIALEALDAALVNGNNSSIDKVIVSQCVKPEIGDRHAEIFRVVDSSQEEEKPSSLNPN